MRRSPGERTRVVVARALVGVLVFQLAAPGAGAADLTDGLVSSRDVKGKAPGSEYVSGDFSHPVLMQVNLWGGVTKPGIHYVPVHTDLITLLSYAGGPVEGAKLNEIVIKRKVVVPAPSLGVGLGSIAPEGAPSPATADSPGAVPGLQPPVRPSAQLEEKEQTLHVNLEDFINGGRNGALAPPLQANDIVFVPVTKPVVSSNTVLVITILGTLASVVVAGVLVEQQIHK